jgi:hypothetical protein
MEHPSVEKPEADVEPDEDTRTVNVKRAGKLVGVLLAAVLPSLVAFFGAGESAKSKTDEVKDKAESGYQFTREALTEIRESIKVLRANDIRLGGEITELKRKARLASAAISKRREPPPAPAPAVVAPVPSAPLPPNLDNALVQQNVLKEQAKGDAKP